MLQQYEPQLCDLLTLSKTLSVVEDDQLKEKTHNDTQLLRGSVCVCVCVNVHFFLCMSEMDISDRLPLFTK